MNTQYIKYLLLPTALFSSVAFAQEEESAEMVNVAFRKVAAEDVLGGVSVLNYEQLSEKNYNTYSLDNMQGYVSGFNGASLWGKSDYLVLVDGVPREANNVKPEEIASITFLKSAQAVVLYGSRAAKGAILITTKRGEKGDMKINVNVNSGWNVAKSYPEYLGSAEYMTLFNEAKRNDGEAAAYSQADIYNYASGQNIYRYPNINFYSSDYIKKVFNRWEVSTEFKGGGERARYYANIGYDRSDDFINFGMAKDNYTDRLNVRGNVDMNLADWITAYVDANVTFYGQKSTRGANFWEAATTTRPNRYSPLVPVSYLSEYAVGAQEVVNDANLYDGCLIGALLTEQTNVFADIYRAGHQKYNSRHMEFTTGINMDLEKVLKGLSFKTMVAVDYATQYTTYFEDQYASYHPVWSNINGKDEIAGFNPNADGKMKFGEDRHTGIQSMSGSSYTQTILFNAHFDYDRTFADNHNVSALLLANGYQQVQSGRYHAVSNANLGLQANYNFAHKYYVELGSALVHSAKLAEGNRQALNYAATLGWNVAKEDWLEGSIFSDLTLSAGISQLNQDIDLILNDREYYLYAGTYDQANGAWWDWGGSDGRESTQSKRGSNDALDFIKMKEWNASVRVGLFEDRIKMNAAAFSTKIEGLPTTLNTIFPSYFQTGYPETSFIPVVNYNNDKRYGFEIGLNYNDKIGEVEISAGANLTYYKTEATRRDDSQYVEYSYQNRTAKPLDTLWGLQCLGYFATDAEAEDYHTNVAEYKFGDAPKAGDLKYKDQNKDGIIDNKDQVDLGRGGWYGNPLTFGINLSAKYKGFSLFVLGVGGLGGHAMKDNSYWRVDGDDKYSAVVRGRCIVEDGKVTNLGSATYPRLTAKAATNNFQASDYWMYETKRFDLAKVQLSYECPSKWFQNQNVIKGVSAFVNGSNLLTIAPEKDILEMNVGSAPQYRTYMAGVNVTF